MLYVFGTTYISTPIRIIARDPAIKGRAPGDETGRGEGRRPDIGGNSQIEGRDFQKDSPSVEGNESGILAVDRVSRVLRFTGLSKSLPNSTNASKLTVGWM